MFVVAILVDELSYWLDSFFSVPRIRAAAREPPTGEPDRTEPLPEPRSRRWADSVGFCSRLGYPPTMRAVSNDPAVGASTDPISIDHRRGDVVAEKGGHRDRRPS